MKAKGFTLIEVLLAMILLSIVMYIGSLSFSIFSERWRKDLGGFNTDVSDARKLLLLRQVLHGAANYLVRDQQNRAVYLFAGEATQLTFVTNSPLFQPEAQALVRLTVRTLDNGQQQLLYSESSFASTPLFTNSPLPEPEKTIVLLQSENIRFNYFGWESFAARIRYTESYQGAPSWQPSYAAADIGVIPYAVNLSWSENEPIIFALPHDNRINNLNVYDERDEA
jgi:prepilin-type N-terminal cleavage/methylation domain-containing protein